MEDRQSSERMSHNMETRAKLPCLNQIIKERTRQNGEIKIHAIPEALDGDGCYKKIADVLKYILSIKSVADLLLKDEKRTIRARFAADGRKNSAKIGSVMSVISLVDENNTNLDHQYTIALYNGKEDYDELKECLGPIFTEIEVLATEDFNFNGVHLTVEWICCCDWKFLALAYGLNAACSEFFCIWCYCTKALISCLDIEDWPIERFISEFSSLATKKTTKERKGCIAEPLVPIPIDAVVIDTLHLFLRIMGLLFNQVVDNVLAYQEEETLVKEMKKAGVPFKFFTVQGEESSITKFTKLDGQDLKKVLYNLNVKAVLERIPTVNSGDVEELWAGFQTLTAALSAEPNESNYLDGDEFQACAREWGKAFIVVNGYQEDITPYIHGKNKNTHIV
ncbi:hypothetical protein AC249_AIPGENE23068 [Exaiptasia diaphana]|nr:hypothetical protein AC249_AIPGENE23068 [Exaiptasia diaphana]